MSREVYIYARNKKTKEEIMLTWKGADTAQVISECFDLNDQEWTGTADEFARLIKKGLDAKVEKCVEELNDLQESYDELKELAVKAVNKEVSNDYYERLFDYKNDLKEAKDNVEWYAKVRDKLVYLSAQEFLQPEYGQKSCDWEMKVVYSY